MTITLGFDVYGTLIDTAGIASALEEFTGEKALQFSSLWREKQLEYSFRRGLMQNYCKFTDCTRNALDYTCAFFGIDIPLGKREELMHRYKKLPPFGDALEALPLLKSAGFQLYAFSNGPAEDVTDLLENCGILNYFQGVVSTDEMQSFKPNPAVYAHFLRRTHSSGHQSWLISGNSFDVIGALSVGMQAAWVRRSKTTLFDPWEFEPTLTIRSLIELEKGISSINT